MTGPGSLKQKSAAVTCRCEVETYLPRNCRYLKSGVAKLGSSHTSRASLYSQSVSTVRGKGRYCP